MSHYPNYFFICCTFFCISAAMPGVNRVTGSIEATNLGLTVVDPTAWLKECAATFKSQNATLGSPMMNYPNYFFKEMPSGLCADYLNCAFERCEKFTTQSWAKLTSFDLQKTLWSDVSSFLPSLNLPSMIAFPKSVSQLAGVVKFADLHNTSVTIKNAGHSITGSSTMKGSVQLNLRSFPKYSSSSITTCLDGDSQITPSSCRLALARNKSATVRVGGGELFDDYYRSVIDWNLRYATLDWDGSEACV